MIYMIDMDVKQQVRAINKGKEIFCFESEILSLIEALENNGYVISKKNRGIELCDFASLLASFSNDFKKTVDTIKNKSGSEMTVHNEPFVEVSEELKEKIYNIFKDNNFSYNDTFYQQPFRSILDAFKMRSFNS